MAITVMRRSLANPTMPGVPLAELTDAKLLRSIYSRRQLEAVLTDFWMNHFQVRDSGLTLGAFERDAIRPHVLGRFVDMLKAVEQHPAMLFFLDNQESLGPDSRAGQNRKRGLNENLAREIMELHTLGVGSGYSQEDVTTLARIITGWTFAGRDGKLGEPGSFVGRRLMQILPPTSTPAGRRRAKSISLKL